MGWMVSASSDDLANLKIKDFRVPKELGSLGLRILPLPNLF